MQTMSDTFLGFEIRIDPKENRIGEYRVTIRLGEGGEYEGDFSTSGLSPWGSGGDPEQYGEDLFDALFADRKLHDAWVAARARNEQRRIRLWIDPDAAELHDLPWELLHDGIGWLSTDDRTPFSRFLPVEMPWRDALTAYPIRILVAISSPDDALNYNLAPVDVPQEQALVQEALVNFLPPKHTEILKIIDLTFLEAPITLARLDEALNDGYHVLHFVGHGSLNQKSAQIALYLQGKNCNAQLVTDDEFTEIVRQHGERCPHLVFLATCDSAKRATLDAFAGLGPKLIQAGIPAVVAMQDTVGVATTRHMTPIFYKTLMEHGEVDRALNTARRNLIAAWHSDAFVPTLLMRLNRGQVWLDMESAGYVEAARRDIEQKVRTSGMGWFGAIWNYLLKCRDNPRYSPVTRDLAGTLLKVPADRPPLEQLYLDIPWLLLYGKLLFREHGDAAVAVASFLNMLRRLHEERALPREEMPSERKEQEVWTEESPPKEIAGSRWAWEPELVFIPAEEFLMGIGEEEVAALRRWFDWAKDFDFSHEQPQHTVYLPDYYIGKYLVTNAQYRAFVQAAGYKAPRDWKGGQIPPGKENHPVRWLYWKDAVTYCDWLSNLTGDPYRLPTEAEWEKAARGADRRIWPWGNEPPTAQLCNFNRNVDDTTLVGLYSPQGDSPYGCADMAGNVWEWTSTRWGPDWAKPKFDYPYRPDDGREEMDTHDYHIVRGGAYLSNPQLIRCASRFRRRNHFNDVGGLRLCMTAPDLVNGRRGKDHGWKKHTMGRTVGVIGMGVLK